VIITQGNIHGSYTTANSVLLLDDYCGSYLYENGTSASVHPLTKILTPEGYIDMSTSGYPYCYFKQDHLGSNREVTSYAGTTGTVVQQTEYYPSGTAYVEGTGVGIQPFKFTGKELIIMHGLNWQDYGARWLDNVRMQWTTMDPLCEKYYAISPYTYCSDDPAKNIDPDGRSDFEDQNGKFIKHVDDGSNAVFQQTGSGASLYYEFTNTYKDQKGVDAITDRAVTSSIQEQQNLNMDNKSLQQFANGPNDKETHCNQATQDILKTVGSALGDKSLNIIGSANEMMLTLKKGENQNFRQVDQKTAEDNAKNGGLSIVGVIEPDHGHITTYSAGENVTKGQVANIGPKRFTGYEPLNQSINKEKQKYYFILIDKK